MKYLIGGLAVFASFILLARYLPSAFKHGFTLQGHFISAAVCAMIGVAIVAYRLKGK